MKISPTRSLVISSAAFTTSLLTAAFLLGTLLTVSDVSAAEPAPKSKAAPAKNSNPVPTPEEEVDIELENDADVDAAMDEELSAEELEEFGDEPLEGEELEGEEIDGEELEEDVDYSENPADMGTGKSEKPKSAPLAAKKK